MKFKPTHRVLVKATETNHSYDLIAIDIINGTYKKVNIKQQETKIRVTKDIFAEEIGGNALSHEEAKLIVGDFNSVRDTLGFKPVEFYRLNDEQ